MSHSSINEYLTCGMKYKLNRIDRLKPDYTKSAFIFGSAVDDAVDCILNKKVFFHAFIDSMSNTTVNGEKISVPKSMKVKYSNQDYQPELLNKKDLGNIDNLAQEYRIDLNDLDEFILEYRSKVKKNKKPTNNETRLYNYINWSCLFRKGLLLLNHFKSWANKTIEEVVSIQKGIRVTNNANDTLVGYIDFIAKFKDGKTRIIDLKTSSNPKRDYPPECANDAQQLIIYSEIEGIDEVGYYVLDKVIRKKEPRVRDRYITGKISKDSADKIFDNIEETMVQIKKGKFNYNWNACFKYGKCEYYDFCKSGGQNQKNLVKLEQKKEL